MNFNPSTSKASFCEESLIQTSNLCMENNNVGNVTSIVDSFENGDLYKSCSVTKITDIAGLNVKQELDNTLTWLDTTFVPFMLHDARRWDSQDTKEYFEKIRLIKQKYSKIHKFMKNCRHKTKEKVDSHASIPLQSHQEHLNDLNGCVKQKPVFTEQVYDSVKDNTALTESSDSENLNMSVSTSSDSVNMNKPATTWLNKEMVSGRPNLNMSVSTSIDSININKQAITFLNKEVVSVQPSTLEARCSNCGLKTNSDFKFNFKIQYHPILEKKVYSTRAIIDLRDLDGLGVPTFQIKAKQLFTCLICSCDIPSYCTYGFVQEHMNGQRHSKKKVNPNVITALYAYHENWKMEESRYQAHHVYFLPFTNREALCEFCGVAVPYEFLQLHINGDQHKEKFMKLYQNKNTRWCFENVFELQSEVYFNKAEINSDRKKSENEELGLEETSEELSEEQEEESNEDTQLNISSVSTVSDKPIANGIIESPKKNTKTNQHVILPSVLNPSGSELNQLLEHRFLPHLKCFVKSNMNMIECVCCKMKMEIQCKIIRSHICSKEHQTNAAIKNINYQFYCEICNIVLKQNKPWFDHLIMPKHIEKCARLGASRKNKLIEYECETCKLIIFGDDLSIKRHMVQAPSKGRFSKRKEVFLGNDAKHLLKSQQHIEEKCFQLLKEANGVLLNQEPVKRCCQALESVIGELYPKCKVYPFGSRVSGLGNEKSDIDLFVDMGDMYLGTKSQDARSQEKFVSAVCKALRKRRDEFSHVNPIPTARTPIVQVFHMDSNLDCDLSFRHGLSVENTKFLRLCIHLQPVCQTLILLLKQWTECCHLQEHVTTYALSMLVIFYLQVNKYLMPVQVLRQLNPQGVFIIDGWTVTAFTESLPQLRGYAKPWSGSITDILKDFFSYYGKFNYSTDVACPLLGYPIKKILFLNKPKGEDLPLEMLSYVKKLKSNDAECFRATSPFCIQDPFDLSHNLVKACVPSVVDKFKVLCNLTLKHLSNIG